MKRHTLIIACVAVLTFMGCTKEIFTPKVEIDFDQSIYNAIEGTATVVAHVTDDGGELGDAGICYTSNGSTPNLNNGQKHSAGASKDIRIDLTSLPTGDYRVRAYATNRAGTAYSDVVTFTITGVTIPTVDLGNCTYNSTAGSATLRGTVTSTGGATITQAGFVYIKGTSGTPTTSHNRVLSDDNTNLEAQLSNLSSGTYRVRAFATNSEGTSYSSNIAVFTINRANTHYTLNSILGTYSCTANVGTSGTKTWTGATISYKESNTSHKIEVAGLFYNNSLATPYFYALGDFDEEAQCIRLYGGWKYNDHSSHSYYWTGDNTLLYSVFYPMNKSANGIWYITSEEAVLFITDNGGIKLEFSVPDFDNQNEIGYGFHEYYVSDGSYKGPWSIGGITNLVMTKTSSSTVPPPTVDVENK